MHFKFKTTIEKNYYPYFFGPLTTALGLHVKINLSPVYLGGYRISFTLEFCVRPALNYDILLHI